MLIVVAEFFVELIKNPQIKFAKDHALIQSLSRVIIRDNYTRDVSGRNAPLYDPASAYISSDRANIQLLTVIIHQTYRCVLELKELYGI